MSGWMPKILCPRRVSVHSWARSWSSSRNRDRVVPFELTMCESHGESVVDRSNHEGLCGRSVFSTTPIYISTFALDLWVCAHSVNNYILSKTHRSREDHALTQSWPRDGTGCGFCRSVYEVISLSTQQGSRWVFQSAAPRIWRSTRGCLRFKT